MNEIEVFFEGGNSCLEILWILKTTFLWVNLESREVRGGVWSGVSNQI